MKKILLILGLSLILTSSVSHTDDTSGSEKEKLVWICTGRSSECYHSDKSCKGLNSCRAEKKEVTLEYAKDLGRRPCKMCY